MLQRQARAHRHAVERILGHVAGHAGDLGQELVDVAQQGAAAGHDHALVDDVAAELGRGLLEDVANGRHELLERRLDGLHHLGAGDRDGPGQAGNQVPATDVHAQLALERQGRPDRDLDLLGAALADHQVVLLADVGGDRLIELVAAHPQAGRYHDPAQGDDRDLTGPAADVDDHVPGRSGDRHVGPDRGSQRLLDQVGRPGARLEGRIADGPLLDAGHAGRHADHHVRPAKADRAALDLADEVAEQGLGDHVVGDHAVLHGPDGGDVAGRPADHLAGVLTHGHDPVLVVDGHHRRLLDDDALALDVDQDVGGTQVDADLHALVDFPLLVARLGAGDSATVVIAAPSSWNFRPMFSYPR